MDLTQQLYVFAQAGGARFVIEAVRVSEVAQPTDSADALRGHLPIKDLSVLMGGEVEGRPGTVVVLDTSPTAALRVTQVEGVFAGSATQPLTLSRALIPFFAPAVRSALLYQGRVYFELDAEGSVRGLPKHTRRRERHLRDSTGQLLVFSSNRERLAVPLNLVSQVLSAGNIVNRVPGSGEFLGAVVFEQKLLPLYGVTTVETPESLVVLVDVNGEKLGLSAEKVEGVVAQALAAEVPVLDVERMFS